MDVTLTVVIAAALTTFVLIGILEAIDKIYRKKHDNMPVSTSNNPILVSLVFVIFMCLVIAVGLSYIYLCVYSFT